jgi:hypothetical protein
MTDTTSPEPELLAIYLRNHCTAGTGGVALLERCRRSNADNALGATLRDILAEVQEDATLLEQTMDRLGVKPSRLGSLGASVAEKLGRLKPNGHVRSYSPLSRVLELELLMAGIDARGKLWVSLNVADPARSAVTAGLDLPALAARAEQQRQRLAEHHLAAARLAFGPAIDPAQSPRGVPMTEPAAERPPTEDEPADKRPPTERKPTGVSAPEERPDEIDPDAPGRSLLDPNADAVEPNEPG